MAARKKKPKKSDAEQRKESKARNLARRGVSEAKHHNGGQLEKHNYSGARSWYMLMNLNRGMEDPEISLKDVASKFKIPPNMLYKRSRSQGWVEQMRMARSSQEELSIAQAVDLSNMNQAQSRAEFVNLGKMMAQKAGIRIAMQDPTALTFDQATRLGKNGQEIVAKAQGWPEKFVFEKAGEGEYQEATKKIAEHQAIEGLAADLLKFLVGKRKEREEAIDGELVEEEA